MNKPDKKRIIVLDNIRSVLNVGAIFRTVDAIGDCEIWLVGITPTPIDRFGRTRADFHKTALGSEKSVEWQHFSDEEILKELIQKSRDDYKIISVEQTKNSIDYKKIKIPNKSIMIFGSETSGVSTELLKVSDQVAELPMSGLKESLNVAVTAGIVLYRWFDR